MSSIRPAQLGKTGKYFPFVQAMLKSSNSILSFLLIDNEISSLFSTLLYVFQYSKLSNVTPLNPLFVCSYVRPFGCPSVRMPARPSAKITFGPERPFSPPQELERSLVVNVLHTKIISLPHNPIYTDNRCRQRFTVIM